MLLETGQPALALAEFEKSQAVEPNRYHGFAGAARAAELAGAQEKAKTHYAKLLEVSAKADAERPEVKAARVALSQ